MGYFINAWVDDGLPRLEIINSIDKRVCLSWVYERDAGASAVDANEVKRLFKQLIILTCEQNIKSCRLFSTRPTDSTNVSLIESLNENNHCNSTDAPL